MNISEVNNIATYREVQRLVRMVGVAHPSLMNMRLFRISDASVVISLYTFTNSDTLASQFRQLESLDIPQSESPKW